MKSLMKYMNIELELEVVDKNGDKVGPSYTTQITQINNENGIEILAPTFDKYIIPLPIDTEIKIILKKATLGDISLNGVVVSKFNIENKILLKINLKIPKDEKCPNTSTVKIDCDLKAEYLKINLKNSEEFNPSKVINISEYGLTLLVNEDVNLPELLDTYIWINDRKIINVVCNIMEKSPWSSTNEYKYQLKLSFAEISTPSKDAIIKYIFGKQNERLRQR